MPPKLERCVRDVKKSGKSKNSAWAICQSSVMKKGKNANKQRKRRRTNAPKSKRTRN